jgi:hypothetical protein
MKESQITDHRGRHTQAVYLIETERSRDEGGTWLGCSNNIVKPSVNVAANDELNLEIGCIRWDIQRNGHLGPISGGWFALRSRPCCGRHSRVGRR